MAGYHVSKGYFFLSHDLLDSKSLLKTILAEPELYIGGELTLHSVCTTAAKVSVESVVESLVSRYEGHFDSKRQVKEDYALDEMEIAENGPNLPNADMILSSAMDKTEDVRTYTGTSKVVDRLMKIKPKFPFMV